MSRRAATTHTDSPRVLLINPPTEYAAKLDVLQPPLGLGYLASSLEADDVHVRILDLLAENTLQNRVSEVVKEYRPHIVGITTDITRGRKTLELFDEVRAVDGSIISVAGGPFPTVCPKYFRRKSIDFVVIGEGEHTFREVVKNYPKRDLSGVKGLCCNTDDGQQVIAEPPAAITNLDGLPPPAWHLFPMKKYRFFYEKRVFPLITSRGCPYSCIFCNTPTIFGKKVRTHSPGYVVEMIRELKNRYRTKKIIFRDSEINANTSRLLDLCASFVEADIDIRWYCNARVDNIDLETLERMKQAGCALIRFGVESGDPETLAKLKKRVTVGQIRNAVSLANQVGISVALYFMIGFPWDTKESIYTTIDLVKSLDIIALPTYFLFPVPLPKTELWEYCTERGLIDEDEMGHEESFQRPVIGLEYMSAEELISLRREALRAVHGRSYLLNKSAMLLRRILLKI